MRILIDTDPGIDDAMALLLAAASPELEIAAVTTVFGNNPNVPLLTRNALAILALAGRPEIPVAMGARRPLAPSGEILGKAVHGDNGLGGATIPEPASAPSALAAAELIVSLARTHSGDLTLVTLAPLTNIALALALAPDLATHVSHLSMMGGAATVPGNATPAAEANILNDPEAAHTVFQSGLAITMSGLDVTSKVTVSEEWLEGMRDLGNRAGAFIHAATQHYLRVYYERGERGLMMHDVHAVMALIHPEIYTMREVRIDVETHGKLTRGQTVADWRGQWGRPAQTRLLVNVDGPAFCEEFRARIATLP